MVPNLQDGNFSIAGRVCLRSEIPRFFQGIFMF